MTPSDVVGARLKQIRRARGVTAQQLAQRCKQLGLKITAQAISNIETGRRDAEGRRQRDVTLEELLGLAYALDVSPVVLLMPSDDTGYQVTPEIIERASAVGSWIIGPRTLPVRPPDPADADFAVPIDGPEGPELRYIRYQHPGEEFSRQHRYFAEWPTYLHRMPNLPEVEERARQLEAEADKRIRHQEQQLKELADQVSAQLRELEYAKNPDLREPVEQAIAEWEAKDDEER